MKRLSHLAIILAMASAAWCGQVTGKLVTPTSGPVAGATITFKPSQSAIVTGSYSVVPSSATCYTSTDGTIVGIPDPAVQPVVNTNTASGSLAAGTYYVVISYYSSVYETYYSPETTVVLSAPGSLIITAPTVQPTNATAYKVYIGTSSGTETLQSTQVGWTNYTRSTSLAAGSALPSSNTSICTLVFGDTMIPANVTYYTNVVDAQGSQLPGFPQNYYLLGSTSDFSALIPASNLTARFPYAIVANPSGNAQQSINSPVTLNGYKLTAGIFAASVNDGITQPLQVVSTLPVDNLTVKRINSTTTVNTTNNWTITWTNPAAARAATIPDPGADGWNLFWTPTPGAVDCTQSWIVCTLTTKVYFETAGANGSTGSLGWDTFSTNAPVAAVITGSNTIKGVANFNGGLTLVQQKANNLNPASATTITLTPLTTTAGNLLIAVVSVLGSQTITGCNDGSAYTLTKRQQNGTTLGVEIWRRENASALAGATLTCTAGGSSVMGLQFYEYTGNAAAAFDVNQGGTGTGTSIANTVTAATAQASELVFSAAAVAGSSVTLTPGSAYNAHSNSANTQSTGITAISEGKIANTIGTHTGPMTIGSSAVWASAIATFKAASATAPTQAMQRGYLLPTDFSGPLNVNLVWFNPSGVPAGGTVQLGVATACTPAGSTDDPTFNTAGTATAAVPTTTLTASVTSIAAVPITACAAGNMMHIQVQRVAGDTNDNYEQPVQMYGTELTYQRTQ